MKKILHKIHHHIHKASITQKMRKPVPLLILAAILVLLVVLFHTIPRYVPAFGKEKHSPAPTLHMPVEESVKKTALFGGGCFWCVEADFEKLYGVIDVVSGYTGGIRSDPTYEDYAEGGHREVVLITYDSSKLSYKDIVEYGIKHSDPTDNTGSFYDRGVEYAPAAYYENASERQVVFNLITDIDGQHVYSKPIIIEVLPRSTFWPAEEYHQDYYKKNPLKYSYYRQASGRDAFVDGHWGSEAERKRGKPGFWKTFIKPDETRLRELLTNLQYRVTQQGYTEQPFRNEYYENEAEGIYVDVVSGEPLFLSTDKYDSGTGWPSFVKPITPDAVILKEDNSLFGKRVEVRSRYADSHLGHVFDDGPVERGGKRYCMNSAALRFVPKADMEKEGYGVFASF